MVGVLCVGNRYIRRKEERKHRICGDYGSRLFCLSFPLLAREFTGESRMRGGMVRVLYVVLLFVGRKSRMCEGDGRRVFMMFACLSVSKSTRGRGCRWIRMSRLVFLYSSFPLNQLSANLRSFIPYQKSCLCVRRSNFAVHTSSIRPSPFVVYRYSSASVEPSGCSKSWIR